MMTKLLAAFRVLLDIARADPADKLEIKRLHLELDKATAELAALRGQAPTPEQETEFLTLLDEYKQAVTPEEVPVEPLGSGMESLPPSPIIATRRAQSIYDAREHFAAYEGKPGTVHLTCEDGDRTTVAATLEEAEAFYNAASIPPSTGETAKDGDWLPPAPPPAE